VVASEVRSLAQRSAEAAKEIKGLINASVERVEQGTVLVDKAGTTMTEVVNSIKRVTDIMGEISAASSEQSSGMAQVGEAGVTKAASEFQKKGLISYHRGEITVQDRSALEAQACSCYAANLRIFAELTKGPAR